MKDKKFQAALGVILAVVIVVVVVVVINSGDKKPLQSHSNVFFAFDWPTPDMAIIPVVVAEKEGFFQNHGINVYNQFPPNTSTTTQMLSAGSVQIGFVTTTDIVTSVDKNIPVQSIANYSMSNNWGLFTRPGRVLTLADLKGKKVFSYGDTWSETMLPFVYKQAGIKASDVRVVTSSNDIPLLLNGSVDFSTSTTNYEIPGIAGATQGKAPGSTLTGSTIGVPNIPIWGYATTKSYEQSRPDNIKAFLAAVKEATQWAIDNPAKAVDDFESMFPTNGYSHDYNTQAWGLTVPLLKNADGKFFVENDAQWSTLCSAMMSVQVVQHCTASPASYYTNQFQP